MNCYECKHRRNLAGDCHSACAALPTEKHRVAAAFSVTISYAYGAKLKANRHGVQNGWFNWPFNFDPIWVEKCEYFEEKD